MKQIFPFAKNTMNLNKNYPLYRLLNVLLLSGIWLFCAGKYFGIPSVDVASILTVIFTALFIVCIRHLEGRGRTLLVLGTIVVLFVVSMIIGLQNFSLFIKSYVHWLLNQPPWQAEWVYRYRIIQAILLAFVCYILECLVEKDFRIKICLAFLILGSLIYCLFNENKLPYSGVLLIFIYLFIVCIEITEHRWKKVKRQETGAYVIWIMPFVGLYFMIMLLVPVPDKPYDWKVFKDIYHQIQESFRIFSQNFMYGNGEEYEFALSGFSDEGEFPGGIFNNEQEIMTLQSKSLKTNIYLIGKVYDTFDGREWLQLNEGTIKERYIDTLETLYAAERYDKQYLRDYLPRVELKIRYQFFRSSYLFAPLKTWGLEVDGQSLLHESVGGSLLFDEIKGYGTEYVATFYQMNAGHALFTTFLDSKLEEDEELFLGLLSNINSQTDEKITLEDVENYQNAITQFYLSHDGVSEDVQTYLEQITEGAETDVEKLTAIEKELASFTYTKTPGAMPDTVTDSSEFLDYFLLESKKGYCNHFATAFVLLARAEGIPARYVQGFCVPMRGEDETIVSSDMAHVWPEVYLEGIGWIPFEPTPGYAKFRYTPWSVSYRSNASETAGEAEQSIRDNLQDETMPDEAVPDSLEDTRQSIFVHIKNVTRILAIAVGLFLVLAIFVLCCEKLIRMYRYNKMNESKRYRTEVAKILRILERLGLKRQDDETLEELQKRTEETLEIPTGNISFWEEYEAFLYGDRKADTNMLKNIMEEEKILLQILKKQKKIRYWIEKIFF